MSKAPVTLDSSNSGFQLYLEPKHAIVRVSWNGHVTLRTMKDGFNKVRVFAEGRALRGAISDFSEAKSFELSSSDIYALSQERPVFRDLIPRITVGGADHIFGMARMYELINEDSRKGIHVVRSIEEAYAILKVANPAFELVDLH